MSKCINYILLIAFINIIIWNDSLSQYNSDTDIFWGDLHTHSELSFDAECSIDDLYIFSRDTSQIDFVLASEHDIRSTEHHWTISKEKANQYNESGKFVTFIGYEWTGYPGAIGGHRIVFFPGEDARRFNFESNNYGHISKLIPAVQHEGGIMIMAHPDALSHSNLVVDNINTQIGIELVGVGNSRFEYFGNKNRHINQIIDNSVRNAFDRGMIAGAIGSSDSHNCRPGMGGLTAVFANELNRESIFNAIKNRRTYATSGARIYMDFYTVDLKMGDIYRYSPGEVPLIPPEFNFYIRGVDKLSNVQIVKNSEIIYDSGEINSHEYSSKYIDLDSINKATYYYLRAVQSDGHIAWSSPIFFKDERELFNLPVDDDVSLHAYFSYKSNSVNVVYYLKQMEKVNIVLYDILGRHIKSLINGFEKSGINHLSFDISDLANGLYFVNMTTPNTSLTKKTVIIR